MKILATVDRTGGTGRLDGISLEELHEAREQTEGGTPRDESSLQLSAFRPDPGPGSVPHRDHGRDVAPAATGRHLNRQGCETDMSDAADRAAVGTGVGA